MSETAFAELESQVESLTSCQLEELQWKIAMILLEKKRNAKLDISGLKKYLGKVDLDINLDSLRGRDDPSLIRRYGLTVSTAASFRESSRT